KSALDQSDIVASAERRFMSRRRTSSLNPCRAGLSGWRQTQAPQPRNGPPQAAGLKLLPARETIAGGVAEMDDLTLSVRSITDVYNFAHRCNFQEMAS
ncbi:MAG: hypothetical protein U1E70_25305, partial [Acetobacteraceae bacterium]